MFLLRETIIVRPFQRNQECYCGYFILIVFNQVRFRLRLGCPGSLMSLYGPTFHVTPVNLCIIFQYNLYISCIMSFGNKIVSKLLFQTIIFPCTVTAELMSVQCQLTNSVSEIIISNSNAYCYQYYYFLLLCNYYYLLYSQFLSIQFLSLLKSCNYVQCNHICTHVGVIKFIIIIIAIIIITSSPASAASLPAQ